ncbi:MAG: hypothetical protein WCI41_00975 [bacterium]
MILTLFSIAVTTIPFLLFFCFKNKTLGFLYVFTSLILFHFILSITTQLLHIFNYQTIAYANAILAIISLVIFIKRKKYFEKIKINYLIIFTFLIIIFQLWSVHYLYTGKINTVNGSIEVTNNSYTYPYFSDEWIGASLAKYSIENQSLPIVNPINNNVRVPSPLLAFFSFTSEIFLFFNLNPILNFPILSIIAGLLICLMSYIFLRINNIDKYVSVIVASSILYITNSANLPGIWYFLPYTMGLLMMIICLGGLYLKDSKLAGISSVLSIIFYPPIIIFIAPIWIVYLIKNHNSSEINKYVIITTISLSFILFFILGISINNFQIIPILKTFSNYIIRPVLDNGIPDFSIWNIIPIIFLPIIFFGLVKIIKDKLYYILAPILTGVFFWIIYTFILKTIIIEYPRVVVITSVLLIISSGFGFDYLYKILKEKYPEILQKNIVNTIKIAVFLLVAIFSLTYTNNDRWSKLVLKLNPQANHKTVSPAPPANEYLTESDINLFSNIHQKRFISIPWKGLTIGVVTNNFPLESKPAVITNQFLSYGFFMSSDCVEKNYLAEKYSIDYVYSSEFACNNFDLVGNSPEKLFLYKYKKD